ncbi:MAG: hypothetical protein J1F42_14225, partial [Lachnospiraceae bacterium]|nr:hypothetical protein [Lachnospiraceae bacterium]
FAQAREYRPETGRFHAQDVVAGNGAEPVTLNRYTYCLGNPVGLVDLDGRTEEPVLENIAKTCSGLQENASEESFEQSMANRCHSYWHTPQGLLESQTPLALDSELLRMSDKGKEALKYLELDVESSVVENVIERDPNTGEVIAVKPYYVIEDSTYGITFGFGHFMSYAEVMSDPAEMKLFKEYIGDNVNEDIFNWTKNIDPNSDLTRRVAVPGSTAVPIEVLNDLFESDVESMTESMLKNMLTNLEKKNEGKEEDEKTNLALTIQQLDALLIYRFQHGTLGRMADWVEDGLPEEKWTVKEDRSQFVKDLYFGNIFTYERCQEVY